MEMKKFVTLSIIVFCFIFLTGCASCPESCDDNNKCTKDFCSSETNYKCVHENITPCLGNGVCEEGEYNTEDCPDIAYLDFNYAKAKNWDADPEIDGLKISITPKTEKSDDVNIINPNSTLEVKLWNLTCQKRFEDTPEMVPSCMKKECVRSEENLLEEWNISIRESNLEKAHIKAEYENLNISKEKDPEGCMLVTLKTNGSEFSAKKDSVSLKKVDEPEKPTYVE